MTLSEGKAVKSGIWQADEILWVDDINFLGYAMYQNYTDMLAMFANEARPYLGASGDCVTHGLELTWATGLTMNLSAGSAVGFSGSYLVNGVWGFIASAGDVFSVVMPQDVSVAVGTADPTNPRIDTIEIQPVNTDYNQQIRSSIDPSTNPPVISNVLINTRREYGYQVRVVAGTAAASPVAPAHDAGWVKIAEVYVPAAASAIAQTDIKGPSASSAWTTEASATIRYYMAKAKQVATSATTYTIAPSDRTSSLNVTTGSNACAVNLPSSALCIPGDRYTISKVDSGSGTVQINPDGADTINGVSGSAAWVISRQWGCVTLQSIPGGWETIAYPPSVSYASKSSNIAAEVNSKYILALNTDLTLPATASEGDVIKVKAIGHSNILQSDAEHVITYRGLYKTSSKGTPGFAALYGCDVNLIFKGAGGSLLAGPVKIADPATLPVGAGRSAAFSPDGRYLAVAETTSPYVIIYDWITGSPVKIADPATLPAGQAYGAAFSPDGRYLAVAEGASPYVIIYDWITGSPVKIADPATLPAGQALGAAFSPDGRYLAVAEITLPYVIIYDWITGSPVKIADPATLPPGQAYGAAFSPDGRYLAIASSVSPYLVIYDWISGSPVAIPSPATLPPGAANGAAFSPDGQYLAIASSVSPYLVIYDWITGSPVKIANPATLPAGSANGAAFSPDGRYLAVAETTSPYVIIYDWITGSPVKIADPATLPPGHVDGAAFSPDGRYLAVAENLSPYITIYQIAEAAAKAWMIDKASDGVTLF